jgi:hypothetical protein
MLSSVGFHNIFDIAAPPALIVFSPAEMRFVYRQTA